MKFHVGQYVKVLGPFYYGSGLVAKVTHIHEGMEYPIRIEGKTVSWSDQFTEDGLLYDDEPKDSMNSVYIEPLTKLERLLLGLE